MSELDEAFRLADEAKLFDDPRVVLKKNEVCNFAVCWIEPFYDNGREGMSTTTIATGLTADEAIRKAIAKLHRR